MSTLLTLEHGVYTRGALHFADLNLSLSSGDRVALLGRNGSGKTTLLELLLGALPLEDGTLWRAEGLSVGQLAQRPDFGTLRVAELLERSRPHTALEAELRALELRLSDQPELLTHWDALHSRFEALGGYTWDARAEKALGVLDLTPFLGREAAGLSGGEQTRLALALTLLAEPDLLLLDEPTNHLDIRMRVWLEDTLKNTRSALLFTSHDRALHDAVALRSWWVEGGAVHEYPGGYRRALAQRTLERRTLERQHRVRRTEALRLERSQQGQKSWGRRSSALSSRLERLEVPEAPPAERRLRLSLQAGDARSRLLLWGEHLRVGYGQNTVLDEVAFRVRQGDRIALIGPNGSGKTTLLRLILGELHSSGPQGVLHFEGGASLAYLDQQQHGLNPRKSLLEDFTERFGEARAVALLGRFGFGAGFWTRLPAQLSGGERARAGLALVSGQRADLLLLDEPTNHLDVETLEALEEAVLAFEGAVIVVTHDRRFAEAVANRVWSVEHGRLLERGSLNSPRLLDPARVLDEDPLLEVPEDPTPQQRRTMLEDRLLEIEYLLDERAYRHPLSQREEGRLRSELSRSRVRLYELYAELHFQDAPDAGVRQDGLSVQARRGDVGALLYAQGLEDAPFLRWDGLELHWEGQGGTPELRRSLLLGAFQILLERWDLPQVRCRGVQLSRAAYEVLLYGSSRTELEAEMGAVPTQTRRRRRRRRKIMPPVA